MLFLTMIAAALVVPDARLIALRPDLSFPPPGKQEVKKFEDIDPSMPFDEAIVSWNVEPAAGAFVEVEARAHGAGFDSDWMVLGKWSLTDASKRGSVEKQRDAVSRVSTDTLQLDQPAKTLDLRVTLSSESQAATAGGNVSPELKFVTVAFSRKAPQVERSESSSPAWGHVIDVPQRAQNAYPRGGVLCSPTSVSMILWHWSNVLHRPELNRDVPEVEAHVWDKTYHGAGNWPFNTAYAGSFPGLRAYVSRFSGMQDLESWIAAGLPVICSVSFDMLRGKPLSATESGHLVVLVGFTKDGDPILNDPAFQGDVRRRYLRADFVRAWEYSRRTVYLIYPEDADVPPNVGHLWAGKSD